MSTQRRWSAPLTFPKSNEYSPENYLILDETARRNLEIFSTIQDNVRAGSLFSLINETLTPMGARRLRWWMGYPLVVPEKIRARLAAVAEIKDNHAVRSNLRKTLSRIYDLERLAGRVALRVATPRDLIALKSSLAVLPQLQSMLTDFTAPALVDDPQRDDGYVRSGGFAFPRDCR